MGGWTWENCPVSCDKCPHITANPTTAAPTPATAAPTPAPSEPCSGRVDVFQHGGYEGWVAAFTSGDYNKDAFVKAGAKDNDASSIQVHGDCVAQVFEGANFDGKWSASYNPGKYDHPQFTAGGAVNDQMSS